MLVSPAVLLSYWAHLPAAAAILWWLKIAKDYRAVAEAIEEHEKGASASTPPPLQSQQQPMQQQRAKSEPEHDK